MSDKPKFDKTPNHWFFMPYVLLALHNLGGTAKQKEITEAVLNFFDIPDALLEERTKGRGAPVIEDRVHWAVAYLGWLEYMNRDKGDLSLNDKSKEVLPDLISRDKKAIDAFVKRMRAEGKQYEQKKRGEKFSREADKREASKANEILEQELGYIKKMNPIAFERLCLKLFKHENYVGVENTRSTKDGGFDGVAYLDFGLVRFKVIFECKKYDTASVSAKDIRAFIGSMLQQNADRGVFITTSRFTGEAREEARTYAGITLITGERLLELLKKHRIATRVETIISIDEDKLKEPNFGE